MRTKTRKENKLQWFVMTSRRPEMVESFLDAYNADEEMDEDDKVADSFIPSLAIKRRKTKREGEDDETISDIIRHREDANRRSNEVRSSIRRFVFLQMRPSGIEKMQSMMLNASGTYLWHYRDGEGNEITVRDALMRRFINGCLEYGEKFELRTKDSDISEGIKVTVREGEFKGFEGLVHNVHFKGDGVRFSIAIKFLGNDQYIHIHDRKPDFVTLQDQESPIFDVNSIDRIESSLLSILSRRTNNIEVDAPTFMAEEKQLRDLYYFRHAVIDEPLLNMKLEALMSICATLCKNSQDKSKYNQILKENVKNLRQQTEDVPNLTALAYQLTALYLSTKDAGYRDELKSVVLHQLPEHRNLRRFVSLVRNKHCHA